MRKKLLGCALICALIVVLLFCVVGLVGCEQKEEEGLGKVSSGSVLEYVDPDTGVHYLIFVGSYKAGMTVRYNADGTIMVDPIEEGTNE